MGNCIDLIYSRGIYHTRVCPGLMDAAHRVCYGRRVTSWWMRPSRRLESLPTAQVPGLATDVETECHWIDEHFNPLLTHLDPKAMLHGQKLQNKAYPNLN